MTETPEDEKELSLTQWTTKFNGDADKSATAELAAKFMFAMSYYHDRMRLHIMLHPLFFVAGFLAAFYLL
jgi:hypothetical protein